MLDQDTGLSYFGARYYDPTLGRFMGVDPVGFAESNPQSFNRYAYGNNNPYRYADPNGMWAEDLVLALPGMYIGSRSLVDNIKQGNWAGAALDAAGLVTDGVALAFPGVPGGAGLAIAATRAERATAVAAKSASWGLSISETKAALSSAQEAYKGSTVVGHALSKHAGLHPETWGTMTGSMKTWNEQGMAQLRDVIRGPGQFTKQTYDNGLSFMEKRLSDGRGVRLNMDGSFKGFLD